MAEVFTVLAQLGIQVPHLPCWCFGPCQELAAHQIRRDREAHHLRYPLMLASSYAHMLSFRALSTHLTDTSPAFATGIDALSGGVEGEHIAGGASGTRDGSDPGFAPPFFRSRHSRLLIRDGMLLQHKLNGTHILLSRLYSWSKPSSARSPNALSAVSLNRDGLRRSIILHLYAQPSTCVCPMLRCEQSTRLRCPYGTASTAPSRSDCLRCAPPTVCLLFGGLFISSHITYDLLTISCGRARGRSRDYAMSPLSPPLHSRGRACRDSAKLVQL